MSLLQDKWELVVNANYQDVIKTLMSLTTASLVLPFLFIRNFLGVPEGERIAKYLPRSAYWFWGLLFLSLLCDMVFFYASAKFIKVVSGGTEALPWVIKMVSGGTVASPKDFFEGLRDVAIKGAALSFLVALGAFGILVRKVLRER